MSPNYGFTDSVWDQQLKASATPQMPVKAMFPNAAAKAVVAPQVPVSPPPTVMAAPENVALTPATGAATGAGAGAITGATTGALLGSAAITAGVGLLGGLLSSAAQQEMARRQAINAAEQQAFATRSQAIGNLGQAQIGGMDRLMSAWRSALTPQR
jgi:hypothetical protein